MMSAKARQLLSKPHMQPIALHPNAALLSDAQVVALEPFILWLETNGPEEFDLDTCIGFARQHDYGSAKLEELSAAFSLLDFGSKIGRLILVASRMAQKAETFRGITKGRNRGYRRRVSVPVSELPVDWQDALADMKAGVERGIPAPAPSIYNRLENRLCMFGHSAKEAGHAVSFDDLLAVRAFHDDLTRRSAAKNEGTPRYAYVRNAMEELHRFARYCEMDRSVIDRLHRTLRHLADQEEKQRPKKWAAINKAPPRNALRAGALQQLRDASKIAVPVQRYAARNIALARALSCYDPARPEDFVRHTFGETVFWEEAEGAYRLSYTVQKTRRTSGQKIEALLPVWMNQFFDAVILQDSPESMIEALRTKAIRDRRPLIAHYDGSRASYRWYSRVIAPIIGTGAHAMRAIVATTAIELVPHGEIAARQLIGHRQTKHLDSYVADHRTITATASSHRINDARTPH